MVVIKTASRVGFAGYIQRTRFEESNAQYFAAMLKNILASNECTVGLDVILVLYKCDMRSLSYGTKTCEIPLHSSRKYSNQRRYANMCDVLSLNSI